MTNLKTISSRALALTLLLIFISSVSHAKRIGEIGRDEKDKYETRYEAKSSTLIGFGPATASNLNKTDMLYGLLLGKEWQVGSQGGVFFEGKGAFGSSVTYMDGLIGGKFLLTDTDVSPVFKAGLGFGIAKGPDLDTKSGFAGTIGLGLAVFRTSSVHLEFMGSYSTIFASNDKGQPGISLLHLGLYF